MMNKKVEQQNTPTFLAFTQRKENVKEKMSWKRLKQLALCRISQVPYSLSIQTNHAEIGKQSSITEAFKSLDSN